MMINYTFDTLNVLLLQYTLLVNFLRIYPDFYRSYPIFNLISSKLRNIELDKKVKHKNFSRLYLDFLNVLRLNLKITFLK